MAECIEMSDSEMCRHYLLKRRARPVCVAGLKSQHQQESPRYLARRSGGPTFLMLQNLWPGAPHQSLLTPFLIATSAQKHKKKAATAWQNKTKQWWNQSASSGWTLIKPAAQQNHSHRLCPSESVVSKATYLNVGCWSCMCLCISLCCHLHTRGTQCTALDLQKTCK